MKQSEAAIITPNKVTVAFDLIWPDGTPNMIYAVIQQDWTYQRQLGNPSYHIDKTTAPFAMYITS